MRIGARIIVLVFGLATSVALSAEALKVGDPAPDFNMQGSDGEWYTAEQFRGKSAVVLAFFPKAFTGG